MAKRIDVRCSCSANMAPEKSCCLYRVAQMTFAPSVKSLILHLLLLLLLCLSAAFSLFAASLAIIPPFFLRPSPCFYNRKEGSKKESVKPGARIVVPKVSSTFHHSIQTKTAIPLLHSLFWPFAHSIQFDLHHCLIKGWCNTCNNHHDNHNTHVTKLFRDILCPVLFGFHPSF